jgi:hypothetical protein
MLLCKEKIMNEAERKATSAMIDIMVKCEDVVRYFFSLGDEASPLQGNELETFAERAKNLYPELASNGVLRGYLFWLYIYRAWNIFTEEEDRPLPTREEARAMYEERQAKKSRKEDELRKQAYLKWVRGY